MKPAFTLLPILLLAAVIGAAATSKEQAEPAAKEWVALVDSQKYAESWTEASSVFHSGVTQPNWERMVRKVRDGFGPLSSRKFLQATLANSLPGVPDGEYAIVQFDSSFQKKAKAVETITLVAEDGKWKVAGYFIR